MLILKKFARDLPALIGLVIVLAIVLVALIGPWIAPHPGGRRRLASAAAAEAALARRFRSAPTISAATCSRA